MVKKTIEVSESEYAALMMMREWEKLSAGVKEKEDTPEIKELNERLEALNKRKEKLHHHAKILENHDKHDLYIHSFSDGKGVEFKSQMSTHGMKSLIDYLQDVTEGDIETTKEMLAVQNRTRGFDTGGIIRVDLSKFFRRELNGENR